MMIDTLQAAALHEGYASGAFTPADVVEAVYDRIDERGDDGVWIHLLSREAALAAARALGRPQPGRPVPALHGIPFAVKDNIDVAGMPTTAACREFAYTPRRDAAVVARALAAGALLIGKTNLDQFATGLSGTRSPYGIVHNPYNDEFIAGGSSSGSAAAVAAGLVTFALGTDTAGSGRVPAGLTGVVGVKPSRGLASTLGIVPACRSLDCPSVFALSVSDGSRVLNVIAGIEADDPTSRPISVPPSDPGRADIGRLRIGVPNDLDPDVSFDGDLEAAEAFRASLKRMTVLGATVVPMDLDPFLAVGQMLYEGPWLAERAAGLRGFLAARPDAIHPVVASLLAGADQITGTDVFTGLAELDRRRHALRRVWADIDVLLLPTVPRAVRVDDMLADPISANARLGRYTTFVNLLDLAALAVPAEVGTSGVPIGVTLVAPSGADGTLLALGAAWQSDVSLPVSIRGDRLLPTADTSAEGAIVGSGTAAATDWALLAVVGAHMRGEPLNTQLMDLGARLEALTSTSGDYRMFHLRPRIGVPARPGLVRTERGAAIEAEVYRIPVASLGRLLTTVQAPLAIGQVTLIDGSQVLGFLCEPAGASGARDITEFGGWRAFRRAAKEAPRRGPAPD